MTTSQFLAVDRTKTDGERELVSIHELSDEEIDQLQVVLSFVGQFNASYSLYEICADNFGEFTRYHNSLVEKTGLNVQSAHEVLIEGNRLLLNSLSSFRTFIDHQESHLKRISSAQMDWRGYFKQQTAELYDSHFSYRFLWNLRNYIQHCGLPIGGFSIRSETDSSGEETPYSVLYFDRDSLLIKKSVWKSAIRQELAEQPKEMDIAKHIDVLWVCIEELALSAWEIHIHRLSSSWPFLVKTVNEALGQGGTPCITTWEIFENGPQLTNVSLLPLHVIDQIEKVWNAIDAYGGS